MDLEDVRLECSDLFRTGETQLEGDMTFTGRVLMVHHF